jgi:hypothetical protein
MREKTLDLTVDEWMGMYHIAADRADKAEAEVERLRLMVESITGGLDEAIEAVHFLETENAKLREYLKSEILPLAMGASCKYQQTKEAHPTVHCCDWTRVVDEIQVMDENLRQALAELDKEPSRD